MTDLGSELQVPLNTDEVLIVMTKVKMAFLSDPCAHGVRSLGSNVRNSNTFLKPCEDLVKTVNVVNVVKT